MLEAVDAERLADVVVACPASGDEDDGVGDADMVEVVVGASADLLISALREARLADAFVTLLESALAAWGGERRKATDGKDTSREGGGREALCEDRSANKTA